MFKARGFTLIEVLISMVILAVGLLGLAAMQAMSLRDNQDAYYYQQATLLAYEMQDRIRGNSGLNPDGSKFDWSAVVAAKGNSCDSAVDNCTAGDMAAYDYWYWEDSVKQVLPAPKNTATKVVEISNAAQANTPCAIINGTSLCLITRWARINDKSSKLSDTATFYLKVTL